VLIFLRCIRIRKWLRTPQRFIPPSKPYEIFPEYYVIKVNQFNDIATSTLDEWIYYLKNNEIKDEFTAQGIDKAKKLLRVDNLSEEDLNVYFN
jgi:uncharacterized protein (UPF0305 family)